MPWGSLIYYLSFGAGTGLIFILRWFWWRINAWSEITAMFSSGILAILLETTSLRPFLFSPETGLLPDWAELPFIMVITSIIWLVATFVTQPESKEVLEDFYRRIQPGGPGWKKVVDEAAAANNPVADSQEKWSVPSGIWAMILGVILIYTIMFATGHWIYGKTTSAFIFNRGGCGIWILIGTRME